MFKKDPTKEDKKTETAKAAAEATTAEEPEAVVGRATKPAYPKGLTALSATVACEQILKASNWELHHAITGVERVRTIHLAPAVAAYKAEMLEYLNGRQAKS
jgi:hypothetical protein